MIDVERLQRSLIDAERLCRKVAALRIRRAPRRVLIPIIVLIVAMVVMALVGNVMVQRYHCGQAWRDCSPVAWLPCEPIDKVKARMQYYRDRAAEESAAKGNQ